MEEKRNIQAYIMLIVGGCLAIVTIWFVVSYNTLVQKDEQVKMAWSQVQSNIQRKVDLLPNLVKVVKHYASHEKALYTQIATLRAHASKALASQGEKSVEELSKLQPQMNMAFARLYAVVENYPQLRSSEQFLQLQSQIEGAENRINITRMQFNESVREYNAYMRHIPANIVAAIMGAKQKAYFQAEQKAQRKTDLDL